MTLRKRILTVSAGAIACSVVTFGCGIVRLHDAGRLQTATEAVKLSAELRKGGAAVFVPMEENLDAVRSTQERLRKLTNAHEFETFLGILDRMDADEIGSRVVEALESYNSAYAFLISSEESAAESVNQQLDRETIIAARLKETTPAAKRGLSDTIKRLTARLDWIETARARLASAPQLVGETGSAGTVASAIADDAVLKGALKAAEETLKNVDKEKRVEAAQQLVKRAAEQTAAAEHSRLLEFRRYLGELSRSRDRLDSRDQIIACNLVPGVLGHLYAALGSDLQSRFVKVYRDLQQRHQCLERLEPDAQDPELIQGWQGSSVARYVARDVNNPEGDATSPEFIGGVAVLLFHERPVFEAARLDAARAKHRHSIRLSKVAAEQRVDLVHQLSEGLEIYYQGGLKPETLAQLLLSAARVGALTFIGVQQ